MDPCCFSQRLRNRRADKSVVSLGGTRCLSVLELVSVGPGTARYCGKSRSGQGLGHRLGLGRHMFSQQFFEMFREKEFANFKTSFIFTLTAGKNDTQGPPQSARLSAVVPWIAYSVYKPRWAAVHVPPQRALPNTEKPEFGGSSLF